MTRYFMRNTPYYSTEVMMMTVPGFKPRGRGYVNTFKYKAEDVACDLCLYYDKKNPCQITECVCLEERVEAGVLTLEELAEAYLTQIKQRGVLSRLKFHCLRNNLRIFENSAHRNRWQIWHSYHYDCSNRMKAAVYLLASHSELWRRVVWDADSGRICFDSINIAGIPAELYSVYQAAKTFATGNRKITFDDLASPNDVLDDAFQLIVVALLLCRFGTDVLKIGENWR